MASTTYQYSVKAYDTATPPNVSSASVPVSVTTPKGSGGGGGGTAACTNPTWNTSGAEGTEGIGTGDIWWVNNDAWSGSHGPQTIYACNQSSWYAVSNQPNNGGQVETYPDTEYDVAGRGHATETLGQYKSITSTFAEAYPSGGSWDAAYDLWTDNWAHETMIWNQWAGAQSYWATQAKTAVTLDGVPYHFIANGSELIFLRDNQVASGSVNILAAYQWEEANGYAKSSDIPTQLEYGVEVCSTNGNETFPMNGLTFSLN
jgi:hypothetical protein